MSWNENLDQIDLKILSHLQENARITNAELADVLHSVHVLKGSAPSDHERRLLQGSDVIQTPRDLNFAQRQRVLLLRPDMSFFPSGNAAAVKKWLTPAGAQPNEAFRKLQEADRVAWLEQHYLETRLR